MQESEFWSRLEYRLCREMASGYWCDGIGPGILIEHQDSSQIQGFAFVGKSPNCEEWRFTMQLPKSATSLQTIDWEGLFPPEDCHGWLTIDIQHKQLHIDTSNVTP